MKAFWVSAMILLLLLGGYAISLGEKSEISKVVFYVH
jgi:hypothetical protein